MNEEQHKGDERLEGLLRRWGTDEAVRDASVGPCPLPAGTPQPAKKRPVRMALLRWLPPAAAAAMLVAAVVLYLQAVGERQQAATGPPASLQRPAGQATETKLREFQEELARTKEKLEKAKAGLARLGAELDAANERLARAIEPQALDEALAQREVELRAEFAAARAALQAEAQAKIGSLEKALGASKDELDDLKGKLANAEEGFKLTTDQLAATKADLKDSRRRQAAAAQELSRQQDRHSRTLAALSKAQVELASLKAQVELMQNNYQRIYLATTAPGEDHLATRQQAAKAARVIERCSLLRSVASPSSTRDLLDTIEVVFTRLDVLDPYDVSAAESFAKLLRRTDLAARIDRALAEAGQNAQVRALLFESKLILSGVAGVG